MKQEEQLKFIQSLNEKGLELIKSKGHDYAGTTDVLKNFKQMNEMILLLEVDMNRIEGTHMFYILLKIQRLCNLKITRKTINKSQSNKSLRFFLNKRNNNILSNQRAKQMKK